MFFKQEQLIWSCLIIFAEAYKEVLIQLSVGSVRILTQLIPA